MHTAKTAVSRIEYRTNMMRGDADIIPLGYLVEACWEDARWMGMIYRPTLTANERRALNIETWPELADPTACLRTMFEGAWQAAEGEAGDHLHSHYGCLSALHVSVCDRSSAFAEDLASAIDSDVQKELVKRLQQFNEHLQPACSAQVLALPRTRKAKTFVAVGPDRHDFARTA